MEQNTQKAKTAALLEAFGCALAYLLAGKLLATVLPAPAGGARALSFARHCVLAPVAEELVFRGAVQRLARLWDGGRLLRCRRCSLRCSTAARRQRRGHWCAALALGGWPTTPDASGPGCCCIH